MNTLSIITFHKPVVARPIDKFDALERFSAAMQSIRMYREDIATSDAEFAAEHGLTDSLAEHVARALIALSQLPAEWRVIFEPEFRQATQE